ncbi:hypothetical protein [Deinococcus sp.]|uniref:hypothetical protein n=1 Tax=Deinococcus sp. TaxID=47478 RepID=UPI0025BAEEC9|nr:hypothetical protein [Deinococcus sp.]
MQQLTQGQRVDVRKLFGPAGLETLDLHVSRAPADLRLWITAAHASGPAGPASADMAAARATDARIHLGYALPAGVTALTVGCSWRGPHAWTGTLSLGSAGTLRASADLSAPDAPGAPGVARSMLLAELYLRDRRWRLRVRGEETRGGPAGAAALLDVPEGELQPGPLPAQRPEISGRLVPNPPTPVPPVPVSLAPTPPARPAASGPVSAKPRPSDSRSPGTAPPTSTPPAPDTPPSLAAPLPGPDGHDSVLGRFQRAWHALLGLPADPPEPTDPPTESRTPDALPGAVTQRTLHDLHRRLTLIGQDLKPAGGLDTNAARLRVRHAQLLETHSRIEHEARDLEDQRGRLRALNLLGAQEAGLRAVENEIERAVQALQAAADDLATELVGGRLHDSRARLGAEDRYLRGLGAGSDRSRGGLPAPPAAAGQTAPDPVPPAGRAPLEPPAGHAPAADPQEPVEQDGGGLVIPWLNRR